MEIPCSFNYLFTVVLIIIGYGIDSVRAGLIDMFPDQIIIVSIFSSSLTSIFVQ